MSTEWPEVWPGFREPGIEPKRLLPKGVTLAMLPKSLETLVRSQLSALRYP